MSTALASLIIATALESLLWLPVFWKRHRSVAGLLFLPIAAASITPATLQINLATIAVVIFGVYRCFNLARVIAGRIHTKFLYHTSRRTAIWLAAMQTTVLLLLLSSQHRTAAGLYWLCILSLAQLLCAAVFLGSVVSWRRSMTFRRNTQALPTKMLPSLTVAIPARNETIDLETCLQTIVASTYPKLEVIVLDDCSQNKRTPEIIRSFAQQGVQFMAGKPPPRDWLAKNYAYSQLATAANGDILLFCGVDTRFEPESFTVLVNKLMQENKSMLSILPRNMVPTVNNWQSWFIQPSRYAWEIGLPRNLLKRPPVLSTCWLISKNALQAAGGFDAVRRKGVPESYFASRAATSNEYGFLSSGNNIVESRKSSEEQQATAVRNRYLQLHRRPELVALISFAELLLLAMPLFTCLSALASFHWLLAALSAASYVLGSAAYALVTTTTYRRFIPLSLLLLPWAALYDASLLNFSMYSYEFSEVLWKGRNVCLPIMQVTPSLPKVQARDQE